MDNYESSNLHIEIPKRIYVYRAPVSMANGFDGLANIIRKGLRKNPDSGDLYLFVNKKRNYLKVFSFAENGWVILSKKLASGKFEDVSKRELGSGELQRIVDYVVNDACNKED